jgi:hypothetical protein
MPFKDRDARGKGFKQGIVVYACNPRYQEAKAGGPRSETTPGGKAQDPI